MTHILAVEIVQPSNFSQLGLDIPTREVCSEPVNDHPRMAYIPRGSCMIPVTFLNQQSTLVVEETSRLLDEDNVQLVASIEDCTIVLAASRGCNVLDA